MKIEIDISDLGPIGMAYLFLALRDGQEQIEDSNGPGSGAMYEDGMRAVIEAGAKNIGMASFLNSIKAMEKA